jgi:hypothetical protein
VGPARLRGAGGNDSGFLQQVAGIRNVSFVDLEMSGFGLRGVECFVGTRVIGGYYHHNGRNGIGCGLEAAGGLLIDGVEVAFNGNPGELGIGGGGMKFARGHGIVVRNSYVHDNIGNGIWCDVQCGDYTVVDNRVIANTRKGIHYEKSGESDEVINYVGSAYIARNIVKGNGTEGRVSADAGIRGVSSKNMLIEDNIFGGNYNRNGIKVTQDDRLSGEKHGWIVSKVVIRNNIMNGEKVEDCSLVGETCSGNR